MLLDFTENWGKIKFMKKLLGILVLGLLWGNISFADRLGISEKKCQTEESQMATVSRKSLTLIFPLKKGEKLREKHVALKRPGTGLVLVV